LGLKHKGHLGIGADGDVAIYTPNTNKLDMFALPRYVLKGGIVIVEQGEIREELFGRTLHAATSYDEGVLPDIQEWFEEYYTIQFSNYPVDEHYMTHGSTAVACGK